MLFNSVEYLLLFLPTAFAVYFVLHRAKQHSLAKIWLVAASLAFYAWWGLAYLPLILISIVCNFVIGTALNSRLNLACRRTLLWIGLVFNLALLGYFKYANFVVDNWNAIAGSNITIAHVVLPLAISFFTFQKIAYLVDSYRGEAAGYNFVDYALFVTFFPQLIAGPIVHHKEVVPQFQNSQAWQLSRTNIAMGLSILGIGLFKKVMIADTFAVFADKGFNATVPLSFSEAWIAALSYTFQLYFDFSGYTDMAIGAALMFNIRLPLNFNSPYKALDIQEFWRRWHITLSRFLRDYLYVPLGGNRLGEIRTYANLFATFLLGGLWHGASWMFVIWGALHGFALIINRLWRKSGISLPAPVAWCLTFVFVTVAWVFFRAKDIASAMNILCGMVSVPVPSMSGDETAISMIVGALAIVLLGTTTVDFIYKNIQKTWATTFAGLACGAALIYVLSPTTAPSSFLYFNF